LKSESNSFWWEVSSASRDIDLTVSSYFVSVVAMRALPPRAPFLFTIVLILSPIHAVLFERSSRSVLFNDEVVDLKEVAGAVKVELPARPVFLEKHGTEGVNYSLDNRSRPFIYCDYYDVNACDPAVRNCPTTKMCYAAARDHRLGCMAALVNNSSSRQITLKGCWMHDGNLGNCDNEACVAEERPTGHGNAALFCCCSTHHCNRHIRFPAHSQPTVAPSTLAPAEGDDPGLFSSDSWVAAVIIFGIFIACLLVLVCYWTYREFRSSQHYKAKAADAFSLPRMGDATNPLMDSAKEDGCRNVTALELVARGRFGQVSRGLLDGAPVAVKVFPCVDANSWIVEQEIYALPALRKHDNILRYIGAEVHGDKYWLITEYHENGSLHDYLKPHVLTLRQALKVIATMLRGLSFLHEERTVDGELKPCVVHRDFKSRNVLLKTDLTSVIADFGLALKCENGQMPAEDHHGQVGTRRYMSPEVLEGATEFTAFAFRQIDVYAAALVIWEVLSRTTFIEGDTIEEYRQPYEEEAGLQPSLHDLRRIVAVQKIRPRIRRAVKEHNIGSVLWKTVEDMWDMEPDGRITSGCAYERTNTLYMSYAVDGPAENAQPRSSHSLSGPPPPYSQVHTSDDMTLRPALMIKDGSLGSNGFNATMDEYAQACTAPPNVRFVGDDYGRTHGVVRDSCGRVSDLDREANRVAPSTCSQEESQRSTSSVAQNGFVSLKRSVEGPLSRYASSVLPVSR
uniref:Serine/threonine-protein kinase receptor n=2 Tax=Parascaris univalens TaxID=6257 RepID=A0A915BZU0_PARUN